MHATNSKCATAIAAHLGVFGLVLASDESRNLSGSRKADMLVERFGERKFDYAGNEECDLKVWERARAAWVVNACPSLAQRASRLSRLDQHLPVARSDMTT